MGPGAGSAFVSQALGGNMQENYYAPPQAEVRDVPVAGAGTEEFYVVARAKFLTLFIATVGVYQIYWFYAHWRQFNEYRRTDLWPVPRAIFSIFFAHSLNAEIDDRIKRERIPHAWSPVALATGYVVLTLASTVLSRFETLSPASDLFTFAALVPIGWCMLGAQHAANAACGQPDGSSNRRLTFANYFWILLGTVFWLLSLTGYYLLYFGDPTQLG